MMLLRLTRLGSIAKATGVDAAFIAGEFDEWVDRIHPYAVALIEAVQDAQKEQCRGGQNRR